LSHVRSLLEATQAVINEALAQVRQDEPEAAGEILAASKAGGFFRVTTCVSTAGMCEVNVSLVLPQGQTVSLANLAFARTH